jgi:hypothetical protein
MSGIGESIARSWRELLANHRSGPAVQEADFLIKEIKVT